MLRTTASALLAIVVLAPASAAQARDDFGSVGTDSAAVFAFVARVNSAVRTGDSASVARLFHYPAGVGAGRCEATVLGSAGLLRRYRVVFSPALRRTLAAVRRDSVFVADGAVAVSSGRIWIGAVGPRGALRIVTINPPIEMARGPQTPECASPLPPVAAAAGVTGTYDLRRGRDAGCTLLVAEAPRSRIHFLLDCNRGAPSYNLGRAEATIPMSRGVAVYRTRESGRCEIRLTFRGRWLEVRQEESGGGCGFGHAVYAGGIYRRLSSTRPDFNAGQR
jgi:hypothetical protein